MGTPFIGQVTMFGFNYAPTGWLFCAGQILPIAQYSALFSILQTAYGGNGTSNFALPNIQELLPVGVGQGQGLSTYVNGTQAGQTQVTLTTDEMASHTHALVATSAAGTTPNVSGSQFAKAAFNGGKAAGNTCTFLGNVLGTMTASYAIGTAGSNFPHSNMQPSLTLNFSIAAQGTFPPRG
ncbi:MAG TPA: tail fiber protein [Rhizomicrobium sp.]|jgi:microcystin-dependent protein